MNMTGRGRYAHFRLQWGRAKTSFIKKQLQDGRTRVQAESNWKRVRTDLKRQNIHYPPASLYAGKTTALTDDQQTKEQNNDDENEAIQNASDNEFVTELMKIEDEIAKTTEERKQKASDQQEQWRRQHIKKPTPDQKHLEMQKKKADYVERLRDKKQHWDLNADTPVKGHPKNISTPNNPDDLIRDIEPRRVHFNLNDNTLDYEYSDTATVTSPNNPEEMPETAMEQGGANVGSKRTADQMEAGPSNAKQANTSGDGVGGLPSFMSVGTADSRGIQSGGLAGAGNNQYFHGFAKSTVPRDPPDYCYVDTYRRPFAIHTPFPDQDKMGSVIYTTPTTTRDAAQAGPIGFQTQFYESEVTHNGVIVPYWFREASMKGCDWNKPMDHVAFEVLEYGFDIPNLRLNILNNDRATVEEVAPAPPADARMWIFVDTNNDYGIPEQHDKQTMTHNDDFQLEDMIDTDIKKYQLPVLGPRSFLLTGAEVNAIMASSTFNVDQDQYVTQDPHAVYDMKRHPGYHEFILSEASLSFSYKPAPVKVRFPHMPNTSLDFNMRQHSTKQPFFQKNFVGEVGTWSNFQLEDYMQTIDEPTNIEQIAEVSYYIAGQSAYTRQIGDTTPSTLTDNTQSMIDKFGHHPVRPAPVATIIPEYKDSRIRQSSRVDVTDDGHVSAHHISKRPPIFTFGVYKELEYKSSGAQFWRYYAYGQINYWVKIRWHVQPNRVKIYLPIGLGGLYTDDTINNAADDHLQDMLDARRPFRRTDKAITDSTAFLPPAHNSNVIL